MWCETIENFRKWSKYIRKRVRERRKFVLALINNMRPSESLNIFQCMICWECCHIYVAVWSNSSMRNCLVSHAEWAVKLLCFKWIKIWQIIYRYIIYILIYQKYKYKYKLTYKYVNKIIYVKISVLDSVRATKTNKSVLRE